MQQQLQKATHRRKARAGKVRTGGSVGETAPVLHFATNGIGAEARFFSVSFFLSAVSEFWPRTCTGDRAWRPSRPQAFWRVGSWNRSPTPGRWWGGGGSAGGASGRTRSCMAFAWPFVCSVFCCHCEL